MPQWNADAFSHNALCSLFQPIWHLGAAIEQALPRYSSTGGNWNARTTQSVQTLAGLSLRAGKRLSIIRCCLDWLQTQGYEQFGILGTSLGSCYGFIASAHDSRLPRERL